MCGIAGIVTIDKRELYDDTVGRCRNMVDSFKHRGPDDSGVNVACEQPLVVLGHVRLSIIDLSKHAAQPMVDSQNGNTLVYNGEIYNFMEIRIQLEQAGYEFSTSSDTEVLLKSYDYWGEDCCLRFNGMFAFAIWDHARKRLFMARDRLGIKPLYYTVQKENLIFASEVRTLLASAKVERKVNLTALNAWLAYGSAQEPETLIKNVQSLPHAHCAIWQDGKIRCRRYWSPELQNKLYGSKQQVRELVSEELSAAVRRRMISDVPLGCFLSGGIDSSAISGIMQSHSSSPINTFSIVFDQKTHDEREFSRLAAERQGTLHTELELTGDMVIDNLDQAIRSFDQPSLDGLNTWFVSKVTKEAGLTVALSGVGGDELFAGYEGFKKMRQVERIKKLVHFLPAWTGEYIQKFSKSEKSRKIGQIISSSSEPYFICRQLFSPMQTEMLLKTEMFDEEGCLPAWYGSLYKDTSRLDDTSRISWFEINTYMLSTLLRDTDQMSMAHALEVRVPLLDHKLVELLMTIPEALKIEPDTPKPLLVAGSKNTIPDACIWRPKQGFSLPFDYWISTSMNSQLLDFFNSPDDFLGFKSKQKIWHDYQAGYVTWSRVWALFILIGWLQNNNISI